MSVQIVFPGGKRVDAQYRGFRVGTDQPEEAGGTNSAPSPFELFLTSLGTCAGYYVLSFCQKRSLPTDGISLTLDTVWNAEQHRLEQIDIDISLPSDFPAKHVAACARAADQCAVKSYLDTAKLHVEVRADRADS